MSLMNLTNSLQPFNHPYIFKMNIWIGLAADCKSYTQFFLECLNVSINKSINDLFEKMVVQGLRNKKKNINLKNIITIFFYSFSYFFQTHRGLKRRG